MVLRLSHALSYFKPRNKKLFLVPMFLFCRWHTQGIDLCHPLQRRGQALISTLCKLILRTNKLGIKRKENISWGRSSWVMASNASWSQQKNVCHRRTHFLLRLQLSKTSVIVFLIHYLFIFLLSVALFSLLLYWLDLMNILGNVW